MHNPNARIVALDIGDKRIGVATANVVARLASPLKTLDVSDDVIEQIKQLTAEQTAAAVVLGLPRNLKGEDTDQTRKVREFGERLQHHLDIPIYWQDEALTSHVSEEKLKSGKTPYQKSDIDALAATYILEDFLASKEELAV
ncbi:MAG: putative pre6S rRNA nuclease [Patescibacteria group bacterium]|nr:putative pre6S rRNA nuclease [Patescibacteria group bacterium]